MKKVLGLDIGTNSIGFSLNEIEIKNEQTIFNELTSNSIIFSEYIKAEDRRKFRSGRRRNERNSRRKQIVRKLLFDFNLANNIIITQPIKYFNKLSQKQNPYILRELAVNGKSLSKDEFTFALYTIISRRGYSNQFKTEESKDDGAITEPIKKNKTIYLENKLTIPSLVLLNKKIELEKDAFINVAIRNKKDDYTNSIGRELWKEELEKLLHSQKNNIELFENSEKYETFKNKLLYGVNENSLGQFEQRPLKSMEDMVGYCSFYNLYHQNSQKRVAKSHISSIEFTLRQRIENSILGNLIFNDKTGEMFTPSKEEIENTIELWLKKPPTQTINTKNVFDKAGLKNIKIKTTDKQDDTILDIKLHTQLLEIFKTVNIDIFEKHRDLYTKILEKIHYFVNKDQIVKEIKKADIQNILSDETIERLSKVDKGTKESYSSFSLLFIDEILQKLRDGKTYQDSLTQLGYFRKYLDITPYDYLPPLNPSKEDIKWLEKNIKNFKVEHLFYQPLVSPNVKRVISILRRLINDLIKKYGKIDQIIIETARELNSKTEEDNIKESQANSRKEIKEAEKLLEANKYEVTNKNIERARLFIEQKARCLYSGNSMTLEEALDESQTEVEHFIPRSKIWINLYKNKILVFKKYNQNKSDKHPITYLKSKNAWEDFQHRVNENLSNKSKINWLTNEDNINNIWNNEKLEDRFLNDTRSATKIIANYLEHYLYPKQNEHGKGETNDKLIRVTGKAINELKRLWGVNKVQPKNEDDKKDRTTNYHHTIDAIVISLLNSSAKKALNDFFKQNENGFKTKAILENLSTRFPKTKEGISLVDFVKEKVKKYENDELYICPMMKKRDNIVGFKDGNIKLYWDEEKKIFCQIDKKPIDKNLLFDQNGKDVNDSEVKKRVDDLIKSLDLPKQNNIKVAIINYKEKLLNTREKIKSLEEQIKELKGNLPNKKDYIDTPETIDIKEKMKLLTDEKQTQIDIQNEPCFFLTNKGQKQIIRNIKIKTKEASKVDSIIITDKTQTSRVKRLTKDIYEKLKSTQTPFVAKLNDTTLNVDLYNTQKGQVIGLNYFSSIKNDISPKIYETKISLIKDFEDKITISKGDLLEIENLKENRKKYYVFNGGGNISSGKNQIELKSINKKDEKRLFITLNKDTIAKKVFINYQGDISYEEFKK
ncbi:type II CRISPR RNA-guided endonuclease Cas9 [Halarcobacter ebronensis]|uniref:CRISPR-associated endonuclease Cas9 n=1 Tax=Halarcobacter ebronensis TaxID=1462615 RepID=A0A4Q0Y7M9_9BACT|nr:type II CRISPR RNA-guided endonuclease Cas9 [Halarcobacter ebronensis]RXJ66197.1 type II CRISPR RNA-guided endonuclease Cas9 [Halarcobacter ebronensis]